jgi:hypothetical protein
MRGYEGSVHSYSTPDSSGHGTIHVASTRTTHKLRESLVAKFTWYRDLSSLTIVFLQGVEKFAKASDLQ